MIGILILSSNFALGAGLRSIFAAHKDLDIIGEAAAFEELEELAPADIIVVAVDADLDSIGQDFVLESDPPPAILLLSERAESAKLLRELELRAWGMLPPDSSEEELLAAIRALYEGLLVGSPLLMEPHFNASSSLKLEEAEALFEELTAREIEVLQGIAQGLANKQIALDMDISEHTVKFHSSAIYSKLGVSSRTEAVRRGVRLGLIAF